MGSVQGKQKQMSQGSNAAVGEEAVHVLKRSPGIGALAVAGIVGPILFTGAFAVSEDAPLHAWVGLAQRIVIVVVLFLYTVALAIRLLRITRAGRSDVRYG